MDLFFQYIIDKEIRKPKSIMKKIIIVRQPVKNEYILKIFLMEYQINSKNIKITFFMLLKGFEKGCNSYKISRNVISELLKYFLKIIQGSI